MKLFLISAEQQLKIKLLTAQELAGLPDDFYILNDITVGPEQRHIDHVVIGPTGVYAIETRESLWDTEEDPAQTAQRGAQLLSQLLDLYARPLVVITGSKPIKSAIYPVIAVQQIRSYILNGKGRISNPEQEVAQLLGNLPPETTITL